LVNKIKKKKKKRTYGQPLSQSSCRANFFCCQFCRDQINLT
jgi:hypothetical protein